MKLNTPLFTQYWDRTWAPNVGWTNWTPVDLIIWLKDSPLNFISAVQGWMVIIFCEMAFKDLIPKCIAFAKVFNIWLMTDARANKPFMSYNKWNETFHLEEKTHSSSSVIGFQVRIQIARDSKRGWGKGVSVNNFQYFKVLRVPLIYLQQSVEK